MDFKGLVSLLLLPDSHQVVLCTLFQHLLILDRVETTSEDVVTASSCTLCYQVDTDLFITFQDFFHVLVPPEEIGEGALHRAEVGHRLVPLHRQLPDRLSAGEALLLLLVL